MPIQQNPTTLELLKQGAKITFLSGFMLVGNEELHKIFTYWGPDNRQRMLPLTMAGLAFAFQDKKDYENSQ